VNADYNGNYHEFVVVLLYFQLKKVCASSLYFLLSYIVPDGLLYLATEFAEPLLLFIDFFAILLSVIYC